MNLRRRWCGVVVVVWLCGCDQPFEHPDVTDLSPGVRDAIVNARQTLDTRLDVAADIASEAQAWGELCQTYHAHHLMDAAAACYRQAIRIDPEDFRWHYYLGLVQRDLGDPSAATTHFRQVLALTPKNRSAEYYLAKSLIDTGDAEQAVGILRRLDSRERDSAVLAALGQALLMLGKHSDASNALDQALAIQPDASQLHYPLAMAWRALGNPERAQAHLQHAGTVEPVFDDPLTRELAALSRSAQFYIERGRGAMQRGDLSGAEQDFRTAITLHPDDAAAQATLALLLQQTGRPDEAFDRYTEALRIEPDNATYHYLAGAVLERTGELERAEQFYERAVSLDPRYPEPQVLLGHMAMRAGRYDDALNAYRVAAAGMPQSVVARYHGGLAALAGGRCDDAIELLTNALQRQATFAPVIIALSRALSVCDRSQAGRTRALELGRQLFEAAPDNAEVQATYAMALAANDRFVDALNFQPDAPEYSGDTARYRAQQAAVAAWPANAAVFNPPRLQLKQ